MADKKMTEAEILAFGFEKYVESKDGKDKKYFKHHLFFGSFYDLPTHREFMAHIFNLGWNRFEGLKDLRYPLEVNQ